MNFNEEQLEVIRYYVTYIRSSVASDYTNGDLVHGKMARTAYDVFIKKVNALPQPESKDVYEFLTSIWETVGGVMNDSRTPTS